MLSTTASSQLEAKPVPLTQMRYRPAGRSGVWKYPYGLVTTGALAVFVAAFCAVTLMFGTTMGAPGWIADALGSFDWS